MSERGERVRRRGGVYVAVLGVSVLVSVIGMAALAAARVGMRMSLDEVAAAQADAAARSLVGATLQRCAADAAWRQKYAAGRWEEAGALGGAKLYVRFVDEGDGLLADDVADDARLTVWAQVGEASRRYSVVVRQATAADPPAAVPGTWRREMAQ